MYITISDTIIFDPEYNDPLDINLISQYKKIIFSDYQLSDGICEAYGNNNFKNFNYIRSKFNQDVTQLPQLLTHLTFGSDFNRKVTKLPQLLTHLTFGRYFNQEVTKLPQLLTHLTFGRYFNQEVVNLPRHLTHLTFGYEFNKTNIYLPLGIKYLKLDCNNFHIISQLSSNIEVLELDEEFNLELNDLPTLLKKIIFHKYSMYNKELNCLPKFVESIQLPNQYNEQIKNLPSKLKKVICSTQYKYIKDFNNLEVLTY